MSNSTHYKKEIEQCFSLGPLDQSGLSRDKGLYMSYKWNWVKIKKQGHKSQGFCIYSRWGHHNALTNLINWVIQTQDMKSTNLVAC